MSQRFFSTNNGRRSEVVMNAAANNLGMDEDNKEGSPVIGGERGATSSIKMNF